MANTAALERTSTPSGANAKRHADAKTKTTAAKVLEPDVCVIGAGSGGLSVAAACAAFGVDVVLIERAEMGGDCLNHGCVPSKALIAAGKQAHAAETAPAFGVTHGAPQVDWQGVHDHVAQVQATIAPVDGQPRFEAMGVTVLREHGRFTDKRTVQAGPHTIRARRFVVATGSGPLVPPIEGIEDVDYHTNETIFSRTAAPGHLLVIGGGPIGMELAQAHRRLGARVTVIEFARVLGKDDPELAAVVADALRAEGIAMLENTEVVRAERAGSGIRLHLKGADVPHIDGDTLLIAAGRRANTDDLGLDAAGIATTRAGIKVSRKLRTTNRRVYAVGDVADTPGPDGAYKGGLQFTHVAGYQAGLVTRAILFRLPAKENRSIIPWATFTDPALAHVGLTEAQAKEAHHEVRVLRWPYGENDRAIAERRTTGLIKMVTDRKGRILGVTIAGHEAGEMINVWALAVSKRMSVKDVAGYVAPYPTMAEIGKRAATTFFQPLTRKASTRRAVGLLRMFG